MEKILKPIFNILKTWKIFIIFFGLGVFAFYVTVKFVLSVINGELTSGSLYEVAVLSLIIFAISFIVAKFFPGRFVTWNVSWLKNLKKEKLIDRLIAFLALAIFFSPLTNLFVSLGLAIFLLSLINPDIKPLWEEIIIDNETIYKFLGGAATIPFFVFIVIAGFICGVVLLIVVFEKILKKESLLKYVGPIWLLGYLLLIELAPDFLLPQEIEDAILKISSKVVRFIIGSIPLGWFYELFIGSIAKEEKDKENI